MIQRTSCQSSVIFIDQTPHDGESGNTSRLFTDSDKSIVGFNILEVGMDTGTWILESMKEKKVVKTPSLWWFALLVAIWMVAFLCIANMSYAFETEASYFTYKSCIKEGTSGICANGQRLVDTDLVAASWDFPLNSYIRVTNLSGRSIVCKVADRGPAKRLYRKGRRLDLSAASFKALAGGKLDRGILQVTVEAI